MVSRLRGAAGTGERSIPLRESFSRRFAFAGRSSKSYYRMPATVAAICLVLLAAWMGNLNGGYFVGDWTPAALVVAALLLLVSVVGLFGGSRLGVGALALGLFTAYTGWTFASLLWSPDMGDAWIGAGQTLLYLLVFWTAVVLVALGASRRWVLAASVLGPAAVAALTLLALGSRPDALFTDNRLSGTVGYYNGEAAFLLVPFWVAIYLSGSRRVNPLLRGAVLAGAAVSVDLAVLAQSRGAMVAMAVSLPVFFLFSGQRTRGVIALLPVAGALYFSFHGLNGVYQTFLNGGDPHAAFEQVLPTVWLTSALAGLYGLAWGLFDLRWRLPGRVNLIAGGLTLAATVVLCLAGASSFARHNGDPAALAQQKWEAFKSNDKTSQQQSRYLSASGSGRYTLWEVAWKDFTEHPLLGVGTRNYEASYYRLRNADVGSVRQPHMLPLEELAERGMVGGVLFFGFLAVCVGSGLRKRFGSLRAEGKAQVGALVAAVAYWFVHSSAEWFWQLPAVTLPAVIYLALLVSPWRWSAPEPGTPPGFSGWPLRAAGLAAAALAAAVVVPLYTASSYLEQSYSASSPEKALAAVSKAGKLNPLDPAVPERRAELSLESGDWNQVERSYEREIGLNPDSYAPYMYMGAFYERRGRLDKALIYYRKASALNPLDAGLEKHVERLKGATS